VNNRGEIDPISAAQIAQSYGIRVYTVGVGTMGEAPYPVQTPFGIRYQMVPVEIDEKVLSQVAEMTEGKYFRATDNKKLRAIYQEIDTLEKTRVEIRSYRRYTELFYLIHLRCALSSCRRYRSVQHLVKETSIVCSDSPILNICICSLPFRR
jgi:Ca-activated chloride channel family protein